MRAIVYTQTGGPDVLRLVDRPVPEPGEGEVRVRVAMSGVNPTDWKSRSGNRPGERTPYAEMVPNQDGSGTIDAVGPGVDPARVGDRVWLWESAWQRADGTAQEYVALPERQAVPLPGHASFELGASLGVPALTAHRCLTVADGGPARLAPGALAGVIVLVAGGAGAVGNAAIQLARWAGATVIATVSSPEKESLARAAGAEHAVNYRTEDAAAAIKGIAPEGVNVIVEVAPVANAVLDRDVLAVSGVIAAYAGSAGDELVVPVRALMASNTRYQFVLLYTVPEHPKGLAIGAVSDAVQAGALRVGEDAGLPLHRFPLEETAAAHAAVEKGAVGKVLIDVGAS
jgi:NADPH2:quinone reductase